MYRSGLAVVVIDLVHVLLKQFLEWSSACPSSSGASGTSVCPSSSSSTVSSGAPFVASPCPWSNELLALAPLLQALAHLLR